MCSYLQFLRGRLNHLCCIALFLLAMAPGSYGQNVLPPVTISVLPDIELDYQRFVAGRSVDTITFFGGKYARRDVVELILLQQALKRGGMNNPVVFAREENYFRGIRNITLGQYLTTSGTLWLEDLDTVTQRVYITSPLVQQGEFIVGLYTAPENTKALNSRSLSQLNQLSIVSSKQWKPDLHTLDVLGFHRIMYTPNWLNVARMIKAGRVDLTLAPFGPNEDKHIEINDVRLVPIPGVKVAIEGSRHWAVSKTHPLGKEFYTALEKGIQLMRAEGTITRAYRECGFFNPGVNDWVLLNPRSSMRR